MRQIDPYFWRGKRVLVTGHMGFKGTWLLSVLTKFGAQSFGFGFDDRPDPLLYRLLSLPGHQHCKGDVNDLQSLINTLEEVKPDIVFHMAAQPLVLLSYRKPLETFQSNILGSANVLEAVRHCDSVTTVIMVTSDKVYRNREWVWAYREDDRLGGKDPYSASKAAAELVIHAMIESYFSERATSRHQARVASVRAGNVIGGGDWAEDRLLPDAARALSQGRPLILRNPNAIRPWQHVLEPLSGYLALAERLEQDPVSQFTAWNFGPEANDALPVRQIAELFVDAWGDQASWTAPDIPAQQPYEAGFLNVDSSRARSYLGWKPVWCVEEAVRRTARWYRDFYRGASPASLMDEDIGDYFGIGV